MADWFELQDDSTPTDDSPAAGRIPAAFPGRGPQQPQPQDPWAAALADEQPASAPPPAPGPPPNRPAGRTTRASARRRVSRRAKAAAVAAAIFALVGVATAVGGSDSSSQPAASDTAGTGSVSIPPPAVTTPAPVDQVTVGVGTPADSSQPDADMTEPNTQAPTFTLRNVQLCVSAASGERCGIRKAAGVTGLTVGGVAAGGKDTVTVEVLYGRDVLVERKKTVHGTFTVKLPASVVRFPGRYTIAVTGPTDIIDLPLTVTDRPASKPRRARRDTADPQPPGTSADRVQSRPAADRPGPAARQRTSAARQRRHGTRPRPNRDADTRVGARADAGRAPRENARGRGQAERKSAARDTAGGRTGS